MWIKRDFEKYIAQIATLPIKVLKGPRQVGKTSLLNHMLEKHKIIYFDDLTTRRLAQESPREFLDQFNGDLILDEASLVPEIFSELKRRVDQQRLKKSNQPMDIWITGSNQTLLQKNVRESLAGRAHFFDLNTLSIHELKKVDLEKILMRGGWPELNIHSDLNAVRYLNDLIATFIEKDIVQAAGIEKRDSFSRALQLTSGRVGQLINFSDIGKIVGVDTVTIQSWLSILMQNGLLIKLPSYHTNLNQRLLKTPKLYFEDVSMTVRLQGWSEFFPLMNSPQFGFIIENLAISEVSKFFVNRGDRPSIFFVRTKEKVEVDLLVELPNQKFVAAEIKLSPQPWSTEQHKLIDSLNLNVVERWLLTPSSHEELKFKNVKIVSFQSIWENLNSLY